MRMSKSQLTLYYYLVFLLFPLPPVLTGAKAQSCVGLEDRLSEHLIIGIRVAHSDDLFSVYEGPLINGYFEYDRVEECRRGTYKSFFLSHLYHYVGIHANRRNELISR